MRLNLSPQNVRKAVFLSCLFMYVVLGARVDYFLFQVKQYPDNLLEDFGYYERALTDALNGGDPYAVREIGPAYLYPPQALLIVEVFHSIKPFFLKLTVYSLVNILLILIITYKTSAYYGYMPRQTWYWYVIALGFAPFLEVLYMGQVNVITMFGIFLFFIYLETSPAASGFGLAMAVLTKVSPIVFVGYLLGLKRYKTMGSALVWIMLITVLGIIRYGVEPLLTYPDAFRWLAAQFPVSYSSLSLASQLIMEAGFIFGNVSPQVIQTFLNTYFLLLMLSSGLMMLLGRQPKEPLFIIISFGVTVLPNVMWYHHYVFLLLPVLIWMGWSGLDYRVVIWCLLGLLLIHADRVSLTYGLLMQIFVHASILLILVWQTWQYNLFRRKNDLESDS